jgi:hypothetical protein
MKLTQKAPITQGTLVGGTVAQNLLGDAGTRVYALSGFPRMGELRRFGATQYDGAAEGATLAVYTVDPTAILPEYNLTATQVVALQGGSNPLTEDDVLAPYLVASVALSSGQRFEETEYVVPRAFGLYASADPTKRYKAYLRIETLGTPAVGKKFSLNFTYGGDDQ